VYTLADQDTVFLSKEQTLYQPPIKDFGYLSSAGATEFRGPSNSTFLQSNVKASQHTLPSYYVNNSARTDQTLYKNKKRVGGDY